MHMKNLQTGLGNSQTQTKTKMLRRSDDESCTFFPASNGGITCDRVIIGSGRWYRKNGEVFSCGTEDHKKENNICKMLPYLTLCPIKKYIEKSLFYLLYNLNAFRSGYSICECKFLCNAKPNQIYNVYWWGLSE